MEKLRRGRRARGTGPFQARLDGMGWPAMRTPLGGRREFRVAAFYAPARKLPVTFGRRAGPRRGRRGGAGGPRRAPPLGGRRDFRVAAVYAPAPKLAGTFGRGAAPPRPREGRDGGGHRRRWTGRGSLVAPTPALPRGRGRGPRAWRAVCPTPTLPRGRGRGTTIRKLRPLPPLAGEGWDGGRAAGALAASVAWLPPPGPPPRAGEGAKGVAGRVPHSNPPSRAGTGHHDPQAPAPSPACGGRLGWGPRRRRACCFRRLAAPTPALPRERGREARAWWAVCPRSGLPRKRRGAMGAVGRAAHPGSELGFDRQPAPHPGQDPRPQARLRLVLEHHRRVLGAVQPAQVALRVQVHPVAGVLARQPQVFVAQGAGQWRVVEQHAHLGVEVDRARVDVERADEPVPVVHHERLGVQAGATAAEQARVGLLQ